MPAPEQLGAEIMVEDGPQGGVWAELKQRARMLVEQLESGDLQSASEVIRAINDTRDRTLYTEVGKLTRGLHDAIRNFEIDTSRAGVDSEHMSRMANAQERLDYVIKLTQSAADRTMDRVEEGGPLAAELGSQARAMAEAWQRLRRREMSPAEFRELSRRMEGFLDTAVDGADRLSGHFNDILMAQDFQDLSGQVLQRVILLVQEVEDRLVDLMRVASEVEELTGLVRTIEPREEVSPTAAEGPQIDGEREGVVSGQDEVDDLLSSLGF